MKRLLCIWVLLLLSPFSIFAQSDTLQAKYLVVKADSLFENANYDVASSLYQKAQGIYRKEAAYLSLSQTQNKLAECYAKQGKYEAALDLANQNLEVTEQHLGKGSLSEANAFNTIGLVQLNKGRDDLALQSFEKALQIYKGQYPDGKNLQVAQIYSNIGLVYWDTDNHDLAKEYQLQALDIRKTLLGDKHVLIGASYNDLGLIESSSYLRKAQKYYEKALTIYQASYGDNHPKVANAYLNLANIYSQEGDYEKALKDFFLSVDIYQAVYGENHPNEGFVYNLIGQTYEGMGNWELAESYQTQALEVYVKNYGVKHPKIANTKNLLSELYAQQGLNQKSLELAQEAIIANSEAFSSTDFYENPTIEASFFSPTLVLSSLQLKARAFEGIHYGKTLKFRDLEMSLNTLMLADQLLAQIRQTRNSKKDKIALGVTAASIYEDAIRICLAMSEVTLNQKKYWKLAFEFSEKSKGAVLLSAVSDTEAKKFASIPEELLEEERELKAIISALEQQRAETADPNLADEYREKLFQANQRYTAFIKKLESDYPSYYNLKFNINIANVSQIQQGLDDETALVSYFLADADQQVYQFVITAKKFEVNSTPMHTKFRNYQIGMQNGLLYKAKEVYELSASALYKQLFPRKLPAMAKKLIVIPTGNLSAIPFEALLTKKVKELDMPYEQWPFLIKKYSVSYYVSATLFVQNMNKKGAMTKEKLALFSPLSFEGADGFGQGREGLVPLPGTEAEVKDISSTCEKRSVAYNLFMKEGAQESVLKSDLIKQFSILHFATHGLVNQDAPELSRIFFAHPSDQEDGNLNAAEIYSLATDASLVVMSACQTGLGKITKGEGMIGLSRAWMYAGVQNQIVSFWTVSDESTAQLLSDFYKVLFSNSERSYAEALHQAKLDMISQQRFADPYFWSAFVLIGK